MAISHYLSLRDLRMFFFFSFQFNTEKWLPVYQVFKCSVQCFALLLYFKNWVHIVLLDEKLRY